MRLAEKRSRASPYWMTAALRCTSTSPAVIVIARVPVSSVVTSFIGRSATSPHWDVPSSYADMRDTNLAKARTGQRPVPGLRLSGAA